MSNNFRFEVDGKVFEGELKETKKDAPETVTKVSLQVKDVEYANLYDAFERLIGITNYIDIFCWDTKRYYSCLDGSLGEITKLIGDIRAAIRNRRECYAVRLTSLEKDKFSYCRSTLLNLTDKIKNDITLLVLEANDIVKSDGDLDRLAFISSDTISAIDFHTEIRKICNMLNVEQ